MEDSRMFICKGCKDYDFYKGCTAEYCWNRLYPTEMGKTNSLSGKSNVERHEDICKELNKLYEAKNRDYGDSFHETYEDFGLVMSAVRLGDKFRRFKTLVKNKDAAVKSESVRDTLIDLANYAIMTVMELDREACKNEGHITEEQKCEES